MPGFDGTGPGGMGPMTGGGRGFCNPRAVRWAYGAPRRFAPPTTRQNEIEFLREEAQALRAELQELEARIHDLST